MDNLPYFCNSSFKNLSVNEAWKKTATLDEDENA